MTKFNRSKMGRSLTPTHVLALGPLLLAACNVYDDSLTALATGLGGSGAESGTSGSAAGKSDTETAGKSGEGGTSPGAAGTAGAASGSSGHAGTAGEDGTSGASGGGAGGGTAGGGSGTAGAGGGAVVIPNLIDDMEDNDSQVSFEDGRNGFWYVGNDETTGTMDPAVGKFKMTPLVGERSKIVAHLKASGYSSWGSDIGFNFKELSGAVQEYDATAFCGVSFWAKAESITQVRVRIPDVDTDPRGGVCKGTAAGQACYDHFGRTLSFTPNWQQFIVKFSGLEQAGTGYHPSDKKLKIAKLYALEWALPGAGGSYQVWIDDVAFSDCK